MKVRLEFSGNLTPNITASLAFDAGRWLAETYPGADCSMWVDWFSAEFRFDDIGSAMAFHLRFSGDPRVRTSILMSAAGVAT